MAKSADDYAQTHLGTEKKPRVVRCDALHVDCAGGEIQVQSVAVQVQRIWRGVVTAAEVEVAAADRRVADQVDARRPALVLVP